MSKSYEEAFQARLTEIVKKTACDLFENAEDFVGKANLMTDFEIRLHFNVNDLEVPTIEVVRTHIARQGCTVICETTIEDFMEDGEDQNIE